MIINSTSQQNYKQFYVPGDGNCMLFSEIFAFLLPISSDYIELKNRFRDFFDENIEEYCKVKNFLIEYDYEDPDLDKIINKDEKLKNELSDLAQKRRDKLAFHMKDNKEIYKPYFAPNQKEFNYAKDFDEFIENTKGNKSPLYIKIDGKEKIINRNFLCELHIKALSEISNCSIKTNKSKEIYNQKEGIPPLNLIHVDDNHYNFRLDEKVIELNKELKKNEEKLKNVFKDIEKLSQSHKPINKPQINKFLEIQERSVNDLLDKQEFLLNQLRKINGIKEKLDETNKNLKRTHAEGFSNSPTKKIENEEKILIKENKKLGRNYKAKKALKKTKILEAQKKFIKTKRRKTGSLG